MAATRLPEDSRLRVRQIFLAVVKVCEMLLWRQIT